MEQFFTPTEPDPEPGLALEDGFPWKRFLWETAQTVMLSLLLFLLSVLSAGLAGKVTRATPPVLDFPEE